MNIKEYFVNVRAHFLADHAAHMQEQDERWMTEGICASIAAVSKETDAELGILARNILEEHRPMRSGVWWFATRKEEGYTECIAPRLAILDKIIESL